MSPLDRHSILSFALGGVVLLLVLPLLVVEVPPILDYPNHLARMLILAGGAPALAPYYAVEWSLLPNLAMDLVVPPLLSLLPLHVAGRGFAAMVLLLSVLGAFFYHRAAFGSWSWWPLASALVAYNSLYLSGFMNFLTGLGLALMGTALWMHLSQRRPLVAGLALLATGAVVFLCHIMAAAFFLLLVGCHELGLLLQERRNLAAALRRGLGRAVAVACLAIMLVLLYAQTSLIKIASQGTSWRPPAERLRSTLALLANYDQVADLLFIAALVLLFAALFLFRAVRVHRGSAIAIGICAVAAVVAPTESAGGAVMADRPVLLALLLLFAGLRPVLPPRASLGLALGLLLILAGRIGMLARDWTGYAQELAELRAAIAPIEQGMRVATVTVERAAAPAYFNDQHARRILSFSHVRHDLHLGALVVTERGAVWPGLFAVPWQQPLRRLEPFADFTLLAWHVLPDRTVLLGPAFTPAGMPAEFRQSWQDWQKRFDYILVLHARAASQLEDFLPDRLSLVANTGMAALYRVKP